MQLCFLAAADQTRLAKTFRASGNQIHTEPYPFVRDFHSIEREIEDLDQLLMFLQVHAEEGHCLLKGLPTTPIVNESRAGRTNAMAPTHWIALDLDFNTGWNDHDEFLASLGLADVSYLLHYSSSAGIKDAQGLRAHIYIQLAQPIMPPLLKVWLQNLNLTVPELRQHAKLSANGMALIWPLDVTTCQNDKLLYIADPNVDGLEDPLAGQRFELHRRAQDAVDLDVTGLIPGAVQVEADTLIAELREASGLPKRKPKYRDHALGQILTNPNQAVVTGERRGRGFTYLNLNGGDSWAYYFPEANPELLFNFKGEPIVRLKDIAPDYYNSLATGPSQDAMINMPGESRLVFRENHSDTYYTALVKGDRAVAYKAQRSHLEDFMRAGGETMPDEMPEGEVVFDPTTNDGFRSKPIWINTFRPTPYMTGEKLGTATIPPTIGRILWSICGDREFLDHTLNWLAYVFQTRKKPKTSLLFSGTFGTGKGLFFHNIVKPLFGPDYCIMTTTPALKDSFNSWATSKLFLALDEFAIDPGDQRTPEILRNLITEDVLDVRAMRTDRVQMRNHLAVLIFTNHVAPMLIPEGERRYNVAPRQEKKLVISEPEIAQIEHELPDFAALLYDWDVNVQKVMTPLETEALAAMRVAAEPTGERILRALREGDLDFFIEMQATEPDPIPDPQAMRYETILRKWCAEPNGPVALDDIRTVYQHLVSGTITKISLRRKLTTHMGWPQHEQYKVLNFKAPHVPLRTADNVTPMKRIK